jgi:hypothetical protein
MCRLTQHCQIYLHRYLITGGQRYYRICITVAQTARLISTLLGHIGISRTMPPEQHSGNSHEES